jgi:hypothetical protein
MHRATMKPIRACLIFGLILGLVLIFCGCSSRYSHIGVMAKKLTVSKETFLAITNGESLDKMK